MNKELNVVESASITFVCKSPSYSSKCKNCGCKLSFYHFELLYSEMPKDPFVSKLNPVCSEECANLLLLRGGRHD